MAFTHSLKNTLSRTYSIAGTLIGAREMEKKRQRPCSLVMTLHASSSQMVRKEAQLTLHHAHDTLWFFIEAWLSIFLFYYPAISSSWANLWAEFVRLIHTYPLVHSFIYCIIPLQDHSGLFTQSSLTELWVFSSFTLYCDSYMCILDLTMSVHLGKIAIQISGASLHSH